jgi:ABC-type phosphate transport system substrate-binding protein
MMKNKIIFFLIALMFVACEDKYTQKSPESEETMNSGKITVYCDEAIKTVLEPAFPMYLKDYKNVKLNVIYDNSRNVMSQLLGNKARIVLNARDYLEDEDSLMKAYKVKPYERFELAYDGLVFFANKEFPVDTLNADQLEAALTGDKLLSQSTAGLNFEPTYATVNQNSSIFANLNSLIIKNKTLRKKVKLLNNIEEVKKQVSANNSIIGVGYLSQLVNDTNFKMIRFGFDSKLLKEYITPKPVHQGYIVQDLYPYKVTYYAYLQENRRNLPFWFATYLAKQEKVQRLFLDKGIVPAFARIKLKYEE